jgi:hypothetical protein
MTAQIVLMGREAQENHCLSVGAVSLPEPFALSAP